MSRAKEGKVKRPASYYVATPIATSACGWCGEPITIYNGTAKGPKRSKYCSSYLRKPCGRLDREITRRIAGRNAVRHKSYRENKKAEKVERKIAVQIDIWWSQQSTEIQLQRTQQEIVT